MIHLIHLILFDRGSSHSLGIMYIICQWCTEHENVSLAQLDSPLKTFSLILFIGRKSATFGAEIIEAGFKAPRVYDTLDTLLDLKVIYDTWESSDRGGGARRVYRLTPLGKQIYEHLLAIEHLIG